MTINITIVAMVAPMHAATRNPAPALGGVDRFLIVFRSTMLLSSFVFEPVPPALE